MNQAEDAPVTNKKEATIPVVSNTLLEKLRALTETNASALYDMYTKEGSSPAFNDMLDDLVFKIASSDEDYAANARRLLHGTLPKSEADDIAQRQRATFNSIRQIITTEADLPTEELKTDIEKAQTAIEEKLVGVDLTNAKSDDLLRKIGILQEDEEGGATFTYPEGLFPESVNDKWDMYIVAVENHVNKGSAVSTGHSPRYELEEADKMRRLAHNSISNDMHKILGFDKLRDEEWGFEDTRRLVAKMREAKFIDRPTDESEITSRAFARGIIGLTVLKTLAERTNH